MTALIPFQFEDHSIRVQIDEAGIPWFSVNDVCTVLQHTNPRKALADHVDPEDVTKRDTLTAGGLQSINHINESGLYALILGSTKREAKRFKRWVTAEVLPTIRKTGGYQQPAAAPLPPPTPQQDLIGALLMIGAAVAKVPGVKPGIAMAATLTCIRTNTGLNTEDLRKSLPAANDALASLNPTQIGKLLDRSAKATNQLLAEHGLQYRNERDEWALTEAGTAWGEALPYARNGHSGYQILWNPAVVAQLREVA